MFNYAIRITNLGKMYRLYNKSSDKILDAFGINFWKKDYYKEFWALRDLNLEIKKGERVGLIGNNGAGKSTMLKTIIGSITPTEGEINVNGKIQALMELGTGFHPEFTGRENIRASLAYQGATSHEIKEKEEEIIEFSELEEFIDQPIRTYSAGMNARLAFSTATAIQPDILIIDEVLGAGDAYFAGKCVERMRKLTDNSKATVLFVSHDLNSVLQLCDRVIWVDRGRIKREGKPLEVIKEYTAAVRKREEYRLKARDLKASKKNSAPLDRKEDIYDEVLFRFICEGGEPPKKSNKIYNIALTLGDGEVRFIDVGGPMDNSPEQEHYIIDEKKYMNWSGAMKDDSRMYREFSDLGGRYKHAPFQFTIPKTLDNKNFSLEVEANVSEKVIVEIYEKNAYRKIGELTPSNFNIYKIDFRHFGEGENYDDNVNIISDSISENSTSDQDATYFECIPNSVESEDKFQYGNRDAQITNVMMLNNKGVDSKVFEINESIKVVIEYSAKKEIQNATFVFCIYTTDGKCASQLIADKETYNLSVLPKVGKMVFEIDRLLIGKGSYVASVGIFKGKSSNGVEAESYHVIDRSVHFEIRQPLDDTIERGMCLQPFKGEILDGKK